MRTILLLTTAIVLTVKICSGQVDAAVTYFNRANKETPKDSAYVYVQFSKKDNLWYGKSYLLKTNALKFEGTYAEKNLSTPVGTVKAYNDDGIFDYQSEYNNGKLAERTWYYKNGNKKAWIFYNGDGKSSQKGWDENGKEINDYVVEKEARFRGGFEGWKRFLEKTLNAGVAAESGAPEGMYTVKVQFIISKEGYVSNVKAIDIPAGCKPCAKEAVAVLTASPAWEPAIQNSVPVIYQAIQHITFQVAEERKRGRRN